MKSKVEIINEHGLHARPVTKWLNIVKSFDAVVEVEKNEKKAKGNSMLGLMSMGAVKGDELIISATGNQAEEVVCALVDFVNDGFGELV